jgi:hypothetical protein
MHRLRKVGLLLCLSEGQEFGASLRQATVWNLKMRDRLRNVCLLVC